LITLLHTIRDELALSNGDTFRLAALIYELFSILQHTVGNEALPEYPYPLQDILSYVAGHFADLHSLTPIINNFYISQSSLERLFKKYLKITPYQYIQAVKMESACRLLAGGVGVTDAAMTSGFSDVSHFIGCFRRRFGMTPKEYAKKLQSKHENHT
jgi:AraC-like DNA-binding protein